MSNNNIKREQWSSYIGFLFASIGSAVGIGNIWRYPYIVGTNGGGAFFVTYIIVLFTFGLAFMMLEFVVGKYYKTSVIESLAKINKKFKFIGILVVGVTFAIISYYLVILGWILSYFLFSIFGVSQTFDEYSNSLLPIMAFVAISAINFFIISKEISKGIERISKFAVILLIVIMVPLTLLGLSMPGSEKGVEFYLTPDFSKIAKPEVWSVAFGQAFFSLSIGMGVLLTFGSYFNENKSLLSSSIIIIIADLSIALLAGFMVFSMVFANSFDPSQGIPLIFNVMPSVFENMEYGSLIGSLFFFLLLLAGITSSISMLQVPISTVQDTLGYPKKKASLLILSLVIAVGLPSALSYSSVGLSIGNVPIFDIADTIFGTYGIAISAAIFAIVVLWFMDKEKMIETANMYSRIKIPFVLLTVVKFALPVLIIATIVVGFVIK